MGSNGEKTWFYPRSFNHQQQHPPVSSSTPAVNRVPVVDAASVLQGSAGPAILSGTNLHNVNEEDDPKKGARKRTRASKKAPTTFFNTDIHNFRAMVQQFTGPSAGSFFHGNHGGNSLSFGDEAKPDHHPMISLPARSAVKHRQKEAATSSASDGRRSPVNNQARWSVH